MMHRREFLCGAAALAGAGALPKVWAARPAGPRVVVVGGGFAGATAAKHLRMWAPQVQVTLIEPNAEFISCPMSNRVLAGSLSLRDLTRRYDEISSVHGVRVVRDTVTDVDTAGRDVRLADGTRIGYDRLILAPGVEMDYSRLQGLETPQARERVLHAWKAGAQTVALRQQILSLRQGGVFLMHVPKAPYRCPPGPYERATMVAYHLKRSNRRGKVLLFDANPDIVAKKDLFRAVWASRYDGLIEYVPNADIRQVEAAALQVQFDLHGRVKADVVNVIPPQHAGLLARRLGLFGQEDKRWCPVNFLTYESLVPAVHVVGDAIAGAPGMPKSAHMANQQAKVCAAAVAALLGNQPVNDDPVLSNTCYSFVSEREVVHVAGIHRYDRTNKTMSSVQAAAGLSTEPNIAEAFLAMGWLFNILNDTLS